MDNFNRKTMKSEMIYLDRNENNYGPAPACLDVLHRSTSAQLSSYDRSFSRGITSPLSERIAQEAGIAEDRVLLGYGAEHLLKQTIQCYLHRGEKLLVPSHSWWYYKRIASEVGGVCVEYPMVTGTGSFRYDLPGMRRLYRRERPSVVFISSPNNPTGNAMDRDDLSEILSDFRDAIVVVDEAYVLQHGVKNLRAMVDSSHNVILVRSFSKYYALAGMRIGFALLGSGVTELRRFANRYLGYHRLSEEVALAALDSPEYYRDIARRIEADKELYYRELGGLPGFVVYRSEANFILVAVPQQRRQGLQAYLLERGLVVKFIDEAALNSHIRITIGTQEQNRALLDAVRAYCDRKSDPGIAG
jgi:histidinol-phosphate aminotransferase